MYGSIYRFGSMIMFIVYKAQILLLFNKKVNFLVKYLNFKKVFFKKDSKGVM